MMRNSLISQRLKWVALGLFVQFTALPIYAQEKPAAKVPVDKRYVNEVNAIATKPAVKNAFKYIEEMDAQTVADNILLTEIPAPPFKEEVRAKKYAEMLKAAGADSVWTDEVGNVIAKKKGRSGKKTVVLEGHMDTVFPEGTDVKVVHKGDTLYAPGIADDTRALAMILTIMKSMEKAGIKTDADVLFIGTVGEEGPGDLRGVKNLFSANGPKIDSYIAIDGGNNGSITHRALGSHRYKVTFKGPGGHSSGAFGLANPHNALARAIHYWIVDADKFVKEKGTPVTYNVGVIGGGTSVNSIPFESWMDVDMRSESPERLAGIDKLFQQAVQRALKEENEMKTRGANLTVEVQLTGDRPSGGIDPQNPLVQRTMASVKYFNNEPRLGVSSTNSNIPFSKGVPAVTIGRGGATGGGHSLNEWWLNDKGHVAIQQALLLLLSEAGLAK